MFNHYFDENGVYELTTEAYPGTVPAPNCIRTETQLSIPDGYWPVTNSARTGFDLVEDHRGREGWANGEHTKINTVGPLPADWSDTPPDTPPTEEGIWTHARMQADAILMPLMLKQVAETADLTPEQLAKAGTAGYFDEWEPGKTYFAGKRILHNGVVYIIRQDIISQAHQSPDSIGMLAVYEPVHVGGGDAQDGSFEHPFDLVAGMAGTVGHYYRHGGTAWECLRAMGNVLESWFPGMPGMDSFWRRVEVSTSLMAMAMQGAAVERYLLNTTKTTYHRVTCDDAVTGSLRTLEQIAELTAGAAKACGKCQPPALSTVLEGIGA